jgi:cysteine-rich repeat protein
VLAAPTATPTPTATQTATLTPTPTPTATLTPSATPTPVCGDGNVDGGEECDDGNLFDGDCCSSTCQLVHHPSCLDHFFCYQAKTTSGTTKFEAVSGVSLVDRFESTTATVRAPNRLCAPTNKLNEDPTAPTHPDHLEGYPIKPDTKFGGTVNQRIKNQFGTLILTVKKPVGIFVPTAKSPTTPPPAPTTSLDHFECYQAKEASGTAKFVAVPNVTVQDQFGPMTVLVKKPTRLCVPLNKNGETPGAQNHPNHLVCYQVKPTSLPKFAAVTSLFTHNQFGSATIDAKKPAELCVPSFVNYGCGNNVIDPGEVCDGGPCCTATCTYAANSPCLKRWSGVASNVPVASLNGWTQCYAGTYGQTATLSSVLTNCDKANLLLGCRPVGSPDLQIAAQAPRADVIFNTGTSDTPHDANGVGWYYSNNLSWGFAPQGDTIHRNQCDVTDSSIEGGTDGNLRLCWHTASDFLNLGWRCGYNDQLNGGTNGANFERIIFEAP